MATELANDGGSQIEISADVSGQAINARENILFVGSFRLEGSFSPTLQILNGRVNTYLLAKFGVLPQNNRIGVAELAKSRDGGSVERTIRRNAQIPKNLAYAFRRNRTNARRLSDLRS